MRRRGEFVRGFFQNLEAWVKMPATKEINERDKMVHGIPWAAWTTFAQLLESHTPEECGAFDNFMMEHMGEASVDVASETNINVFWTDLLNAVESGGVELDCFRTRCEPTEYPEGCRFQRVVLYVNPNPMLAQLAEALRKQGLPLPLRRSDLRDQLAKAGYMIDSGTVGIPMRFGKGSEVKKAWAFDLDLHPLGRQEVTLEQFRAALDERAKTLEMEVGYTFKDGADPRKGPLYAIVHAVERRERAQEEGTR
jgi:hypothetical protein